MTKNKKSKIPYIFFAFFAIFILVDILFIYISQVTWRGTVMENSYEKGRKYNQTLLKDKKQKNLGWVGNLNNKDIKSKKALLTFDLKDNFGKFIDDAKVKIAIIRPTQTGFDFNEELYLDKKNQNYQKVINFPLKGLWRIEIQATSGKEVFQYVKRIVII